jgi:hypothetical protein
VVVDRRGHKKPETDEEAFDKLRPAYMRAVGRRPV